jgi:polysaccharide biosynthesis transport protein
MTNTDAFADTALGHLLRVVRRRKLLVVAPVLALVGLALWHSSSQSALYRGEADVLLGRANLQSLVNNQPVIGITGDQFFRIQSTQASLAKSPPVAERVLAQNGVRDMTAQQLLGRTEVVPDRSKDLLHFRVEDGNQGRAQRLSEAFAKQYVVYRQRLDTAAISAARHRIQAALTRLDPKDPDARTTRSSLAATDRDLLKLATLQSGNASYVQDDVQAAKVRPTPARDLILAGLLGLVLGVALALVREALVAKVRTPDEAGELLGIPFLGYLPPPRRARRGRSALRMFQDPNSRAAEALRKLALNLEFANLSPKGGAIVVSSALAGEGKSTTIADLAVTLARSSRRVALVDLDLRDPRLHTLFQLPSGAGITDVAVGTRWLDEVRHDVDLWPGQATDLRPSGDGELAVFPAGTLPPNPGEFVSSAEVRKLIDRLREQFDYVLVDAPPLLSVGDTLTLTSRVDAMFLVVRIGSTKRAALRELRRVLQSAPVSVLGFAATGSRAGWKASGVSAHGYGVEHRRARNGNGAATWVDREQDRVPSR